MKLLEKSKKQSEVKQRNASKQQNGTNQHKKARQHLESKQLEMIEYLLKENRRLHDRLYDVQDNLNKLRDSSQSLTDLIHLSWEGIRTKSVDYDEVKNAVNSLYLLSDDITKQSKQLVKEISI